MGIMLFKSLTKHLYPIEMKRHFFLLFTIVISLKICYSQESEKNKKWNYPILKPDTSIDYYFGKKVIDPFRNIEDIENEQVKIWIKKQNELYDTIIGNITNHDRLNKEILAMWEKKKKWANYPRIGGNRTFYIIGNIDNQEIESLVYIDSLHKDPIELFNTKEINEKDKKTYSFNYYEPSFDGKYIAFGISPNGNEMANIFVVDVAKMQLLPEKIERAKSGNIQWTPDGNGFFYTQEKEIITEQDRKTSREDRRVKYHKLSTESKDDVEIFGRLLKNGVNLEKIELPMLFTFPHSSKVLINTVKGTERYYSIYFAELNDILNKPAQSVVWKKICDEGEKISSNVLYGDRFFGLSFKQNPDGQLVTMELSNLAPNVIYNATNFSLDDMVLTYKNLYLTIKEKGLNKLLKINPENYQTENIELPYLGGLKLRPPFSIASFYQPSNSLMFSLSGYNNQLGEYICNEYDHVSRTNIFEDVQYFNPPLDVVVEETEVPSHDGIMVPISILYKKGIKLDGGNPTIIYAYGAYGTSLKPTFDMDRLVWLDHGGIYVFAHVRGGSEKGENWYKGGFKATKSNSWKDLIACSDYVIKKQYTTSQKLALIGSSAGAITIGRAITERPDLFKAAVIYVGACNTLRIENTKSTSVTEYGTVKDSIEFQYLYNMDVYHHIQEGVKYPSILFTAGKNDSRVAPWQPSKVVAKMQLANKGDNVVLLRLEDKGHYDYPSNDDIYSFLFWQLGHPDFKLKEKDSMFRIVQKQQYSSN
jgi:prolyl oligopeptidase